LTAAPISAQTQRTILLLSFATFSSMAVQRICDAMLPELSREFDASLAQAAQVVSLFAVVYGVSQLFYGPLGDHLGKFRVVAWATLACGIGCTMAVFAVSLNMLVLARMATGLAAAAIVPLAMAWIGDQVHASQLQENLARLGLGTALGNAGGQMMGGLMTSTVGWRWAFVGLALLFGVVGAWLLADGRRQKTDLALQAAARATAPAGSAQRPSFLSQSWAIVSGRWSRIVLLVAFAEGAAGFGVLVLWPAHLHQWAQVSLFTAGAIVALFGLGGVGYMLTARSMIHRLGQHGLTRLGAVTVGLCALVIAYAPWWWLSAPASLVAGFGFAMFHNTMQTNAAHMAPAARGTAVSLFAAALFLGQSVGAILAAGLFERIGSSHVVALGGALVAALGLWFGPVLQRRNKDEAAG
jgi:MFS transporter, YNFM family, putative membrane transport protein